MTQENEWKYKGEVIAEPPEGYIGFVYLVRNCRSNYYYIGQKKFYETRKLKPLKGNKNRRWKKKESDWRTYRTSSKQMQAIIDESFGDITFEILRLCRTPNAMNYHETREIIFRDAFFDKYNLNKLIRNTITRAGIEEALK